MGSKRILVAPLNWGLGHAARCIPIIGRLEKEGYHPVLASDGAALSFLKKEFPHLEHFSLPSYDISYTRNGSLLKWKLLLDSPTILRAVLEEKKVTERLVQEQNLQGILSDSRFGVRSKSLPSVLLTHQLHVLSGTTTFLSSSLHKRFIQPFDQIWVPDTESAESLGGILSHPRNPGPKVRYLGAISRFRKRKLPEIFDFTVLLSGPEPQRSILEKILLEAFLQTRLKILFIRGVMDEIPVPTANPNIKIFNYLHGRKLENALNCSSKIIARSGYTTLMDLSRLGKRVFFIPTPGQYEQAYLAQHMKDKGKAPFCQQQSFHLDLLDQMKNYSGLGDTGLFRNFSGIFSFFEGK